MASNRINHIKMSLPFSNLLILHCEKWQKSSDINYQDMDMVSEESIKHVIIITITPEQPKLPYSSF